MTTTAAQVISEVITELQDASTTRWTIDELVAHFNEAQVMTVEARPDTNPVQSDFTPVAGAMQTIPDTAIAFLDIVGNTAGSMRAITRIDKSQLDAVEPNWQSGTKRNEILHFTYDPSTPRVFYVYPPALTTARIGLVASQYPTPATVVAGAAVGNLGLQDWTKPAIKAWVLFRAWSKDAEEAGNAALATAQFGLFQTLLGVQLAASAAAVATK